MLRLSYLDKNQLYDETDSENDNSDNENNIEKSPILNNNEKSQSPNPLPNNYANHNGHVESSDEEIEASTKKNNRRKRKKKQKYDEQEERNLEKLIFGDEREILDSLEEKTEITIVNDKAKRKPVWQDEDDEIQTGNVLVKKKKRHQDKYANFLQDRFVNTYGEAKWAQLDKVKDDDSDDEMLQTSGNLLGQNIPLPRDNIVITKCSYLNSDDLSINIIRTVQFHPMSQVALVACVTGKTTIFQVDGKTNSKIQSIQFDQFPIDCAHFSVDGEQIIVGSRQHSHFYYYHMIQGKIVKVPWDKGLDHCVGRRIYSSPDGRFIVICGRYGYIHLLSAKTKEWIGQLKMNDEVYALTFSPNGKYMYSHGTCSQIYIWDLNRRVCVGQFYDEGCITGTCLAVSPNDQYLAAGADTGVVNIYEIGKLDGCKNPKPIKSFMNLTTEVTSLKFNHSSEILAMASNQKDEAIKLAHFPSMTVFANFPRQHQKHYRVNSLDISLNSGYLSLANNHGKALLYRIKKYENY